MGIVFAIAATRKNKTLHYIGLVGAANILLHLLLDTFVGFVWWLYPFIDKPYYLFLVPNNYSHWIINFVLHWSFLAELLIVSAAIYMYTKKAES